MAEAGLGQLGEQFDIGNVKEQGSEASETDIARVQETLQKAKQMRGQIQQQVQQNRRLAELFSLLLQYVDDDRLMAMLYEQFTTYKVTIEHMFAQFLPWIMKQRDLTGYGDMFGGVWDAADRMERTVSGVTGYMQKTRKIYSDLAGLPAQWYTEFVICSLKWSHILDIAQLEEAKQKELRAVVKGELG